MQLRPKPADYTLEKKYRLGISLFERMINNKIPHVQLLCQVSQTPPATHPVPGGLPPWLEPPPCPRQHRMRPEISQLLVPFFYEALRDHPAVCSYEKIKVGG